MPRAFSHSLPAPSLLFCPPPSNARAFLFSWGGDEAGEVSVFETTIRELGGLLAAFDLSGEMVFLDKATDLGRRLKRAFDTPSGIPYGSVSLSGAGRGRNAAWTGGAAVLAELGTLQVVPPRGAAAARRSARERGSRRKRGGSVLRREWRGARGVFCLPPAAPQPRAPVP